MKLSISNIAWTAEYDEEMYGLMKKYGFNGLEIAPTRIFQENPYGDIERAKQWKEYTLDKYEFSVSSMQSIWFGRQEKLFGSKEERGILQDYTCMAIDFASAINCGNLVFGCPRNRSLPKSTSGEAAIAFFRYVGEYAAKKGTVIGIEANPPIYQTNYINDTLAAIELIGNVNTTGFLLNLDVGTMIENCEPISLLRNKISLINHVHISEPGLHPIKERELHKELADCLRAECYEGYVSVEMSKGATLVTLEEIMRYVKEIFG